MHFQWTFSTWKEKKSCSPWITKIFLPSARIELTTLRIPHALSDAPTTEPEGRELDSCLGHGGCDPFNQNSNRSDREKRTTSKGGPVFPKLFRLDRTDPLSFGPKFPESLVEWIAPGHFEYAHRTGSELCRTASRDCFEVAIAFFTGQNAASKWIIETLKFEDANETWLESFFSRTLKKRHPGKLHFTVKFRK